MKTLGSWFEGDWNLSEAKVDEMIGLLSELVKWSKFGGKQQLKAMLSDNLKEDSEKLAYEYSDGERSIRDIEAQTGVGRNVISRLWQKWFKLGIVEKSKEYEGRMQHICSLEEVGLEAPLLQTKAVALSVASQPTTNDEGAPTQ